MNFKIQFCENCCPTYKRGNEYVVSVASFNMAKYVPFKIQSPERSALNPEQECKKCISWLADQEIDKLFPILCSMRKDRWTIWMF